MFDFLRNITKSASEKRQERLNAYLDGALTAQERRRFETELAEDADLRDELETLRWVKMSVQQLPRVRAPRNFILDPAVYGQRAKPRATGSLYPGLRVATALTAFFFILALTLDLATPYGALNQPLLSGGAQQVAMEAPETMADETTIMAVEEVTLESDPDVAEEDVADVAGLVAEEGAEEESMLAEEPVAEQPAEDPAAAAGESTTDEAPAPGVVAPDSATARVAEETAAAEPPSELTALATSAAPADEMADSSVANDEALATEAVDDLALYEEEAQRTAAESPFPYLFVAEIVLGIALLALIVITLFVRRSA